MDESESTGAPSPDQRLREVALGAALALEPDSADEAVEAAEKFYRFLKGESASTVEVHIVCGGLTNGTIFEAFEQARRRHS